MRKCGKNDVKVRVGKIKTKNIFCHFLKCLLNFRGYALQSELNKVSISNFVQFQLQRLGSKNAQAFEIMTKCSIKNKAKKDNNQATKMTF